ncbi:MAG TPA: M3 family metallopeptidase, partial [Steroidobacteraceae bacterium]
MTFTIRTLVLAWALVSWALPVAAGTPATIQPSVWAAKPDVAAFDKSVDEHLAAARASTQTLVAVHGPRTVENTLQPFDDALRELHSAGYLSSLMESVHPDSTFRDHATAALGKVSSAQSDISLNPAVYHALAAVDAKGADAATQYYLKRQLLEFRLAGVDKDAKTRAELKKLQDAQTEQVSAYDRNIADDVRHISVAPGDLTGLPPDFIASHAPGTDGKISISTAYPDAGPVFTYAQSAEVRRNLRTQFDNRGYPKNLAVLRDMLKTRERIAQLLGYPNWADYNAADKMIGHGASIGAFIEATHAATRAPAEREFQMLLAEKRKDDPSATGLGIDETALYSERVRRAAYDFDSQSVRPYFPYERVKQGILDTAATLFHVSFEREPAAPAWDPSVEIWLVRDQGQVIGRIYLDMHPREGKFSHAAMYEVRDGARGRQLPEAALVCNLPSPTATDPGLMTV